MTGVNTIFFHPYPNKQIVQSTIQEHDFDSLIKTALFIFGQPYTEEMDYQETTGGYNTTV